MRQESYTLRVINNYITIYCTANQLVELTNCSLSAALRFIAKEDPSLKTVELTQMRVMYYKGKDLLDKLPIMDVASIKPFSDSRLVELSQFTREDIKAAAPTKNQQTKKATQLRAAM